MRNSKYRNVIKIIISGITHPPPPSLIETYMIFTDFILYMFLPGTKFNDWHLWLTYFGPHGYQSLHAFLELDKIASIAHGQTFWSLLEADRRCQHSRVGLSGNVGPGKGSEDDRVYWRLTGGVGERVWGWLSLLEADRRCRGKGLRMTESTGGWQEVSGKGSEDDRVYWRLTGGVGERVWGWLSLLEADRRCQHSRVGLSGNVGPGEGSEDGWVYWRLTGGVGERAWERLSLLEADRRCQHSRVRLSANVGPGKGHEDGSDYWRLTGGANRVRLSFSVKVCLGRIEAVVICCQKYIDGRRCVWQTTICKMH